METPLRQGLLPLPPEHLSATKPSKRDRGEPSKEVPGSALGAVAPGSAREGAGPRWDEADPNKPCDSRPWGSSSTLGCPAGGGGLPRARGRGLPQAVLYVYSKSTNIWQKRRYRELQVSVPSAVAWGRSSGGRLTVLLVPGAAAGTPGRGQANAPGARGVAVSCQRRMPLE